MKQSFTKYQDFKRELSQEFCEGNNDKYQIPISALSEVFRTKEELYTLLDIQGEYFLPPIKNINFEFLKKFLTGGKKLFKKGEMRHLERIPRFEELTTKELWNKFKTDPLVGAYHPPISANQVPDRRYLMTLINTLYPNSVHEMIQKSLELRTRLKIKDRLAKEKKIEITKELSNLIFSSKMISCKLFIFNLT